MLIQICKLRGYGPIVAVVGSSHKIQYCKDLGADYVIDKSKERIWDVAMEISPAGYVAIFDANGIETLQDSYNSLSKCGSLVTYGFHSNIPKASSFISPFHWIRVILDMFRMPKFDPMDMCVNSKTVSGFNLSFFADERSIITMYMEQIFEWLQAGSLKITDVVVGLWCFFKIVLYSKP
jgi:NADPH:quinone reductase-like Zn-dependent oxidoreductase